MAHMAASRNCGSFCFAGVLVIRALLAGVYIEAPDCWNLPYRSMVYARALRGSPCREFAVSLSLSLCICIYIYPNI